MAGARQARGSPNPRRNSTSGRLLATTSLTPPRRRVHNHEEILIAGEGRGGFIDCSAIRRDGLIIPAELLIDQSQTGINGRGSPRSFGRASQNVEGFLRLLLLQEPRGDFQHQRLIFRIIERGLIIFPERSFRVLVHFMHDRGGVVRMGLGDLLRGPCSGGYVVM